MIYNAMFLCGLFLMLIATRVNAEELMLRTPLVPARSATVYSGMNARMQQVNFEVGDRVVKGDTLMVLTRRDLRVKETAARIALKKAQTLQTRLYVVFLWLLHLTTSWKPEIVNVYMSHVCSIKKNPQSV